MCVGGGWGGENTEELLLNFYGDAEDLEYLQKKPPLELKSYLKITKTKTGRGSRIVGAFFVSYLMMFRFL